VWGGGKIKVVKSEEAWRSEAQRAEAGVGLLGRGEAIPLATS